MSLSNEHQPDTRRPAFHPIPWEFSSTNSGDTNYRYVFQIELGATIFRKIKVRPRPDDGFGKIDISQHVARLINQQFDISSGNDFEDAPVFIYDFQVYSENSDPLEAALVYNNQIAYNSILTPDEYLGYAETDYRLTGSSSRILVNMKSITKIKTDDIFWFHFMCPTGSLTRFVIKQYDKVGSPSGAADVVTTFTPTQENNMAKMDLSGITLGASTERIGIQFQDSGSSQISEEILFDLEEPCTTFERFKFVYLDAMGSYVSLNFDLKSTHDISTKPKMFRKYIDPVTQSDISRGLQRYFVDSNETFKASTEILDEEHNRMFIDLIKSQVVYLDVRNKSEWPNHDFVPVEILTTSSTIKEEENGELVEYSVEFRLTTEIPSR